MSPGIYGEAMRTSAAVMLTGSSQNLAPSESVPACAAFRDVLQTMHGQEPQSNVVTATDARPTSRQTGDEAASMPQDGTADATQSGTAVMEPKGRADLGEAAAAGVAAHLTQSSTPDLSFASTQQNELTDNVIAHAKDDRKLQAQGAEAGKSHSATAEKELLATAPSEREHHALTAEPMQTTAASCLTAPQSPQADVQRHEIADPGRSLPNVRATAMAVHGTQQTSPVAQSIVGQAVAVPAAGTDLSPQTEVDGQEADSEVLPITAGIAGATANGSMSAEQLTCSSTAAAADQDVVVQASVHGTSSMKPGSAPVGSRSPSPALASRATKASTAQDTARSTTADAQGERRASNVSESSAAESSNIAIGSAAGMANASGTVVPKHAGVSQTAVDASDRSRSGLVPAAFSTAVETRYAETHVRNGTAQVELGIQDPTLGDIRVQAMLNRNGAMHIDVVGKSQSADAVLEQISPLLHAAVMQEVSLHAPGHSVLWTAAATFADSGSDRRALTASGAAAVAQGESFGASLSSDGQQSQHQQQHRRWNGGLHPNPFRGAEAEDGNAISAASISFAQPTRRSGLSVRI